MTTEQPSRKREVMAAVALSLSIFGFVLQTETLGKVATLGYEKPIFIMYITHTCMVTLFPLQLFVLWVCKFYQRNESFKVFFRKHTSHLRQTALQIANLEGFYETQLVNWYCMVCSVLSIALNLAGASWYIAVNMTTTADLTAIYNCATFFAYFFSVFILKEHVKSLKLFSVLLSIVGVFVVAYLGNEKNEGARRRVMGNVIIAFGTILYGLYEVLYKKIACPPQTVSARRQAAFANLIGAGIGVFTFVLMLPWLLFLHVVGWETFELPNSKVAYYILVSIVGNVTFSGSFLILMSLTSPVLGSVSSLLATCVVPLVNFLVWHQRINLAEIIGGSLIIIAFLVMAYASQDDFIEEEDEGEE